MSIWADLFIAFLLNSTWQVAACAGTAWVVSRWMSGAGAAIICSIWRAALCAALTFPLLTTAWGFLRERSTVAVADGTPAHAEWGWSLFLLAGAFWVAVRIAQLAYGVGMLMREGQQRDAVLPHWAADKLASCAAAFPVDAPRVRLGNGETAYTYGWLRPYLILPERYFGPAEQEDAVAILGHELAHIGRRDFAWNLLLEAICALLAFHPLAAWIKSRADLARERACDELAVERLTLGAVDYAGHLLAFARHAWAYRSPSHALSVTEEGTLETRIRSLLSPVHRLTRLSSMRRLTMAATVFAAAAWAVPWPALRVEFAPRPEAILRPRMWMMKAPPPPPPPPRQGGRVRAPMPPPPPPPPANP